MDSDFQLNLTLSKTTEVDGADFLQFIPLWRKIIWIVLFLVVIIVGTVGNCLVLWIIMAHKTMRTVTNLYIANLAIADVLVLFFNVPFTGYALIFGHWPFGLFYCKLNEGIATICICVYVITLFAVSVNRYNVVIAMIKQQERQQQTGIITIILWIISIFVAAPYWIFAKTGSYDLAQGDVRLQCDQEWSNSTLEIWYGWIYLIFSYSLPLMCMVYTYGRISFKLWRSQLGGPASTHNQAIKDRAEKKIIKMMVVVAIMFAICWFPFRANTFFGVSERKSEYYILTFWIAMTNCVFNPFIYNWMNADFRAGFRIAFMWCPLVNSRWDSEEEEC